MPYCDRTTASSYCLQAAVNIVMRRKVLTSRAAQDEDRMSKLEDELKEIRTQAEDADKRYVKQRYCSLSLSQMDGVME